MLLTEFMTRLHAEHRAAGVPCHAGDGLPLACLALHAHACDASAPGLLLATRGATLGLLLTLDMAQCAAPDALPPAIAQEARVPLPDLTLNHLAHFSSPCTRHPCLTHTITDLVRDWAQLDERDDTFNPKLLRTLAYLTGQFARVLSDLYDPHSLTLNAELPTFIGHHAVMLDLLLPTRKRLACS